jgi:hypothetical protein
MMQELSALTNNLQAASGEAGTVEPAIVPCDDRLSERIGLAPRAELRAASMRCCASPTLSKTPT